MLKPLLTGRTIFENHKEWLYFSGTSYLGIPHHPEIKQLIEEGFNLFGTHFGGSRHSNIHLNVFSQAETFLADWIGCQEVLITSSGTLSGQLAVRQLLENFRLIYSPYCHNALHTNRSEYLQNWPASLAEEIKKYPDQPIAILTNSVDPLTAIQLDFSWLNELPDRSDIILIIDDSHGLGILGTDGAGSYQAIKNQTHIPVIAIGSLGKAIGLPAGYIAGPTFFLKNIFEHPLFIGSSTPSPAYLYAMLNAKPIYAKQLDRLKHNIHFFNHHCEGLHNFRYLDEYPVYYTTNNNLYEHLKSRDIICSSFCYPTKNDPPLTRIVINATHTQKDLIMLSESISSYF